MSSTTTNNVNDWARIRYKMWIIFAISNLLAAGHPVTGKQKRQLFREHLVPHLGGKVPDEAFNPQRLLYNKLNQQGIYLPDGVVVVQREHHRYASPKSDLPKMNSKNAAIISIPVNRDEGRYVAPEGRYYDANGGEKVETTYVIYPPFRKYSLMKYTQMLIPVIPVSSLKLKDVHANDHAAWNEIFPPNFLPPEVHRSLIKYLEPYLLQSD